MTIVRLIGAAPVVVGGTSGPLAGFNIDNTITVGESNGYITLTVSGEVPAGSVSNAELATMVANTMKMNATASTAAPTDTAFAVNTFPARASTGNLAAKAITDASLSALSTGLGTMATQAASAVAITGGAISVTSLGVGASSELTIASGVVTATGSYHSVDTEADDPTDDLTTINGWAEGKILVIGAANDGRTVVVKDGTGNLFLNGDFSMDGAFDRLTLIGHPGGFWFELCRSDNNS